MQGQPHMKFTNAKQAKAIHQADQFSNSWFRSGTMKGSFVPSDWS